MTKHDADESGLRYEDRPDIDAILAAEDPELLRRWWPKMSSRERGWVLGRMSSPGHLNFLLSDDMRGVLIDEDVPLDAEEAKALSASGNPAVKRWIARLKRVMAEMPAEIWCLASEEGITIMATNSQGETEIAHDLCIGSVSGRIWQNPNR